MQAAPRYVTAANVCSTASSSAAADAGATGAGDGASRRRRPRHSTAPPGRAAPLQEAGDIGSSRIVEDERAEEDTAESLRQLLAKVDGSQ